MQVHQYKNYKTIIHVLIAVAISFMSKKKKGEEFLRLDRPLNNCEDVLSRMCKEREELCEEMERKKKQEAKFNWLNIKEYDVWEEKNITQHVEPKV